MFRFLSSMIKFCLFAAMILVIGQLVQWKGKTVSDQIKTSLSSAESTVKKSDLIKRFREWTSDPKMSQDEIRDSARVDRILPSERQKLRTLIRELGARRSDSVGD